MRNLLIITVLLFILVPFKLISADSGLTISPAANELILKPGEAYVGSFIVRNNNEYNVTLETQKGYLALNGEVSLDSSNDISTSWISTEQIKVGVPSLKELKYDYSINIPQDAQEGFYRPMFILKLSTDQNESGTVTALTQLIPFQFSIYVSENGIYRGNLKVSKLNVGSSILIGNQQKIDFGVLNTNVSPAKPLVRLQVLSPEGEVVYQTVENEGLKLIGQNQEISQSLNISDSFNSESRIGRYTVELFAKDIFTNKEVSSRIAFWYIPQSYLSIVLILVVLSGLAILTINKIKSRITSKKKEDKHIFMYK